MKDRGELIPANPLDLKWRVDRMRDCAPEFWRFLYAEVGRNYHWVDRLPWSIDEIRAYIADPAVSIWLFSVSDSPAGYFELRQDSALNVELVYFGLLHHFHGRGLGGHFLTQAVWHAWDLGARRVWVHTNTLDHPAALPNYLKRGFKIFQTEEYFRTYNLKPPASHPLVHQTLFFDSSLFLKILDGAGHPCGVWSSQLDSEAGRYTS